VLNVTKVKEGLLHVLSLLHVWYRSQLQPPQRLQHIVGAREDYV